MMPLLYTHPTVLRKQCHFYPYNILRFSFYTGNYLPSFSLFNEYSKEKALFQAPFLKETEQIGTK